MLAEELHPMLQNYYCEVDPAKRRACLEDYQKDACAQADKTAEQGSGSSETYRRELYEARYVDIKHPGQTVDRFLWHLMTFSTIYKSPGLFPKHHRREVLSCLKKMQLDERALTDPSCEEILYWEYRNAVHRYFDTCSSPAYGSTLFGLVGAKEENREAKRCADIWAFSYGIARLVKAEEEMSLLCRAANDEFCALVPEASSLEEEYHRLNP